MIVCYPEEKKSTKLGIKRPGSILGFAINSLGYSSFLSQFPSLYTERFCEGVLGADKRGQEKSRGRPC